MNNAHFPSLKPQTNLYTFENLNRLQVNFFLLLFELSEFSILHDLVQNRKYQYRYGYISQW